MRAKKQKKNQDPALANKPRNPRLPFVEHLLELRKRVFYVAMSVIAWAIAAYFVQHHIVKFLLRPAQDQPFIYTSVGGGIDFLVRVCIYTGIVFSIPVIVYQILKYLQPLIKKDAVHFIAWGSVISGVLALAGMAFGYFLGLPAALHFLLNQFTTDQISPLLTIQSYMSFVTLYLFGSALLFQLPLIMVLINRIKPLKPKKLLGYERWVILLAFILGGIMNPSPRVQDQLMLAVPMILAYQVGILLVWRANRRGRGSPKVTKLLERDAEIREQRRARFAEAQAALQQKRRATAGVPVAAAAATTAAAVAPAAPAKAVIATPLPAAPQPVAHLQPAAHIARPAHPTHPARSHARPLQPRSVAQRRIFNDFTPRRATPAPGYRPLQQDSPAEAA